MNEPEYPLSMSKEDIDRVVQSVYDQAFVDGMEAAITFISACGTSDLEIVGALKKLVDDRKSGK